MKKQRQWLLSKIHNVEDAQQMTVDAAYGFYCFAMILLGVGAFIDTAVIILLAFFLQKFKSRIAAVLLFLFSALVVIYIFVSGGGELKLMEYVFLTLFGSVPGVRAVEASFKYQKYKKASTPLK